MASGSRGLPPKATSRELAVEAASMEAKLAELRRAMEKERAKREELLAKKKGDLPLWRSANNKGATSARGRPVVTPPKEPKAQTPPSVHDQPGECGPHSPLELAGSAAGTRQQQAGNRQGPPPDRLVVEHEPSTGGTSTGNDLSEGHFSEGDSHRSFLDALNEWRLANRGEQPSTSDDPPAPTPRAHIPGAAVEMQTEMATPRSRAPASKPSLFDKLVINTISRQAGLIAEQETNLRPPSSSGRNALAERPAVPDEQAASSNAAHVPGIIPLLGPAERATVQARVSRAEIFESRDWPHMPETGFPHPHFAALERLEELERKAAAAAAAEEAMLDGDDEFVISTADGVAGLTRGARLPDDIMLPGTNT